MVVRTQLTSPGRREGAARRHGAAAHQPPARLPGLRQGRRVPAAEPGDGATGRPSSRFTETKRTFPKPIRISTQVLLDRERCVLCQRCTRFSKEIAGDPFIDLQMRGANQQIGAFSPDVLGFAHGGRRPQGGAMLDESGPAVRELLLRQHRADLPGRRADRRRLPVPGPPVRPRLHPGRLRALRVAAARCASTTGAAPCCAGWPRRPGRQRGVELRQGPLGLHLVRTRRRPARPRRWCATRRPASCGSASWPEALDVAARGLRRGPGRRRGRRARRRPRHRRGRLRLRQVRPRRARHQRRRLPGPPALGRGGGRSSRTPSPAAGSASPTPTCEARPGGAAGRAWSPRRSRRSSSCGCARPSPRAVVVHAVAPWRQPRAWPSSAAALIAGRAGHRGRGARRRRRRARAEVAAVAAAPARRRAP